MKSHSTVLLCSFLIIFLLSCEQKQGNFTSVKQENAYIYGVWKAPTEKSAKEAIAGVSARIDTHAKNHSPDTITQDEEPQQQKNTELKDGESQHPTELEAVSKTLPYLMTAAPETLLPKDKEVTDWVRARKPSTYNIETLYRDRVEPTEIYKNYGFQRQAEVEYQSRKFGSRPFILVEIFDMGTRENAFGIFSVNSYARPKLTWIGSDAIISGKYLRFWKGKYFIQIEGYAIATGIREGMIALAKVTAKKIQDPQQKIPLLKLLPVPYIRGTAKLYPTNWALRQVNKSLPSIIPQLTNETFGVLAQYNIDSKKSINHYIIFVIRYPNVAEAQSAYTQYQTTLMSENIPFETNSKNQAILIDEQFAEP